MLAASRGLDGANASSPAGNTQKVMSPGGNVEKVASSGGAGAPSVSSDLVAAAVAEEVRPKHDGWSRIYIRSRDEEISHPQTEESCACNGGIHLSRNESNTSQIDATLPSNPCNIARI